MMLGYHELGLTPTRDVYGLSVDTFREHVSMVSEQCGARECITFDDGHASNFELAAPVLQEFHVPAIFFLTTSWIGVRDAFMTWKQVKMLAAAGHGIASHTHTHPLLTACSDEALEVELTTSKRILEERVGVEVTSISMPGGRVNSRILAACAAAGYERVYSSLIGEYRPGRAGLPEVIGRYVVTRGTTAHTLNAYLSGAPGTWRRLQMAAKVKSMAKTMLGDSLYQKAWRKALRTQA